jgi:hypothetical protein
MMDLWLRNNELGFLDLAINDGDIVISPTDTHTVAQAVTIRLKTLAGEWFFDISQGIPYLTEIFGHRRNERFIRQIILPEIEAVSGVHQVKDFSLQEVSNRKLLISFTIALSDGVHIPINESIGV